MVKIAAVAAAVAYFAGCGSSRFLAPEPPPSDRQPVPQPAFREINLAADNVQKLATLPTQRLFDLSRYARLVSGKPKEAYNLDAFDEVYDSSWFTNRNVKQRLSLEAISRGPNRGTGPDTSAEWTVFRAKVEGVTPGFSIMDRRGNRFLIKFDPMTNPELATGAELVSTKLFYAAGYNVPENYLVYFNPQILRIGEKVKFTDADGSKRFMNQDDLQKILVRIPRAGNGLIRAVASKYLPGKPLGPFKYMGIRKDDYNDIIPHEHRRELRGLRVVAAWLNHYDTKANNSLDMYTDAGYVKHYLIDFGSTLGSEGDQPLPPEVGREGPGDLVPLMATILTLGIYKRQWELQPEIRYSSIGYFTAEYFHPKDYKYILPNPAFMNATRRDFFWGAKIVMSFTDAQIRAAVQQAHYSDPEAAEYLIRTIVERRDIIGRYWFTEFCPLDKFSLQDTPDGGQELRFVDLAVESGLAAAADSEYRYAIRRNGKEMVASGVIATPPRVPLTAKILATAEKDGAANAWWAVELHVRRAGEAKWGKGVTLVVGVDDRDRQRLVLRAAKRE